MEEVGLWSILQPANRWRSSLLGSCHVIHVYIQSRQKTHASLDSEHRITWFDVICLFVLRIIHRRVYLTQTVFLLSVACETRMIHLVFSAENRQNLLWQIKHFLYMHKNNNINKDGLLLCRIRISFGCRHKAGCRTVIWISSLFCRCVTCLNWSREKACWDSGWTFYRCTSAGIISNSISSSVRGARARGRGLLLSRSTVNTVTTVKK